MSGPFWTRAKVGTATGVLGLMVGAGLGAAGQPAVDATNPDVKALISAGVEKKTTVLDDEADELRDDLDQVRADAADAVAKAEQKAAQAKAAEKAAKGAAKKAKAEAAQAAAAAKRAASKPAPTYGLTGSAGPAGSDGGASGGGSDPLFGTCGEANDNGYGDYHRGEDPEYSHYQDRDGDGVVCEF